MESINYASYRLGEVRTQEARGTEARKRIERITSNSRTLTTSLMNTSECIGLYILFLAQVRWRGNSHKAVLTRGETVQRSNAL